MSEETVTISKDLLKKIWMFLWHVDDGYVELSQQKIVDEYHYYKKCAKELKTALREETETE